MKKLFYLFLLTLLIFSSCSKEEETNNNTPNTVLGCTDRIALNYNVLANSDDESCIYNISGVWKLQAQYVLETGASLLVNNQIEFKFMFDAGAFGTILWSGNNELGYTIIGSTHGNYTLSTIGGNTIEYHGLSITAGQTTPFDIKEDIVALNENSMTSNYTGTTADNPLEILTISSTYIRDTTYTLSDYSGLLP